MVALAWTVKHMPKYPHTCTLASAITQPQLTPEAEASKVEPPSKKTLCYGSHPPHTIKYGCWLVLPLLVSVVGVRQWWC